MDQKDKKETCHTASVRSIKRSSNAEADKCGAALWLFSNTIVHSVALGENFNIFTFTWVPLTMNILFYQKKTKKTHLDQRGGDNYKKATGTCLGLGKAQRSSEGCI